MAVSFAGAKKYKRHDGFREGGEIRKPFEAPVHYFPLRQGEFTLEPLAKAGDKVLAGQKIADIAEFTVNPVICGISGVVMSVTEDYIMVENDMLSAPLAKPPPPKSADEMTTRETLWLLREGGVYEPLSHLPLHVLLSEKRVADCIVVCCFDSDPYVSSPQAITDGNAGKILTALEMSMRLSGITKAYIAVESDMKKAYSDFKLALRFNESIVLYSFKPRYPQSQREVLLKSLTGTDSVNALFLSPETLVNMYDTLSLGKSVTHKTVTVSGDDILEPANYSVPLGMPYAQLLECAGYQSPEIVIEGGVIEGERVRDLDTPVTQDTKAVLAFNSKENIPKYRKKLL